MNYENAVNAGRLESKAHATISMFPSGARRLLSGGVVSGFCVNIEGREAFWGMQSDFDLSPDAVVFIIARFVAQNILVSQLHPDFRRDVRQLVNVPNREDSSTGHLRKLG